MLASSVHCESRWPLAGALLGGAARVSTNRVLNAINMCPLRSLSDFWTGAMRVTSVLGALYLVTVRTEYANHWIVLSRLLT